MSNSYKILSIDESGNASYKHPSKLFVLSGVLIADDFRAHLDRKIINLKKKYLKNEEIVFHSRDMARKKGPFSIFNDKKIETSFWSELVSILNNPKISLIFIIADKKKAKKLRWQPKTVLGKSYFRLLELFLVQLTKDENRGRIVSESDPYKDRYLIQAHASLQSQNQAYRGRITSLCLVTKLNQDSAVQIADALAPIAGMYAINSKPKNRIEQIKIRLLERKLKDRLRPSYLEMLL